MLTESEKRWLETRTLENFSYCFEWCKLYRSVECKVKQSLFLCPTQCSPNAIEDAIDFSERVVAKLAKYAARKVDVDQCFDCPVPEKLCHGGVRLSCEELMLQAARLAVEEEIDADAE